MPYTIQELPPLPGGTFSGAHGLNDSGIVVGTGDDGAGNQRALYWAGTVTHEIPTPTGIGMSIAFSINTTGAIAGFMFPDPVQRAFLYDGVSVHDLGPAGDQTRGMAINDAAEIVGSWVEVATNAEHPVLWSPGFVMTDLGGFGFPFGNYANAIANAPVIGGASTYPTEETHAFLWIDGVMHDLGVLGGVRSQTRGVLALAWPDPDGTGIYAVGGSEVAVGGFTEHAFLWHKGAMNDLGSLPGWEGSDAFAINTSLQVAGYAYTDEGGRKERAVMWDSSGVIHDLTTLAADPNWDVLTVAHAINNVGMIAGYGITAAGQGRGFVMTPS